MRIDRERFLVLAISTLAACEHVDDVEVTDAPAEVTQPPSQLPAVAPVAIRTTRSIEKPPPPPPLTMAQRWFIGLSTTQRGNIAALCKLRAANPCAGLWRMMPQADLDAPGPDPEEQLLAGLSDVDRRQASSFCVERSGMPAPTCETPLVVAFDNQPVEFVQGAAAFAFVPGQPLVTEWPSAATPWIARDLDGDGAITSGAELFGSSTDLGGITAKHGFQALAALDANGDGTIDARDPAFGELLLWTDRNNDRRSTADELRPLASAITAIPLAHTLDPRCNERGACEGERGTLRWRDASGVEHTGAVVDVYVPGRR